MKTFENNSHLEALQRAWAIFSGHKRDQVSEFNCENCVYLPIAGFINGLALWLCAQIILFFQQQSNAGAVILGSFIINALLSWSNNFQILNFGNSINKAHGLKLSQAPVAITQIVILFRLAAVAYLLHKGLSWWLILVPLIPAYTLNTLITKFPIVGEIITAGSPEDGLIGANFTVEKIDGEYEVFYNPISVFVPNIIKNFLGD